MELTRYENTSAPALADLLERDRYAFSVLGNILRGVFGPVSKIVTDHARLILVYTCPPFPGWIWLPQDASEEEMERALKLIKTELPPEAKGRVNMRPALAKYILGSADGADCRIGMQIDAYACEALTPPERIVPGDCYAVGMEALSLAADWLYTMKQETGLDPMPRGECEAEIRDFIAHKRLFLWKEPDGDPVCMCAVTDSGDMGYIGHVYTPPKYRRQGIALSLVYHVTCAMLAQGMKPALCVVSTNAAAAACYKQLGYRVVGSFCTVETCGRTGEHVQ